jgi:hypothetical protein
MDYVFLITDRDSPSGLNPPAVEVLESELRIVDVVEIVDAILLHGFSDQSHAVTADRFLSASLREEGTHEGRKD